MLQSFSAESGAAGGRADQEAPRALIRGRPDKIADPLKSEHRIVDIER